jgi:hypothetical protein
MYAAGTRPAACRAEMMAEPAAWENRGLTHEPSLEPNDP